MEVQPQLNQLTQFWLSQFNQMRQKLNETVNDQMNNVENSDYAASNGDDDADNHETANINAANDIDHSDINACNNQNFDITQLINMFNQKNENFLAALLKKGANQSTQSTQKQQQNALVPPTPPRTPITPSAQHQQVTIRAYLSLTLLFNVFCFCVCFFFQFLFR